MPTSWTEDQRRVYRRYAQLSLPRHTSYPAAPYWSAYSEEKFRAALGRSNLRGSNLSLYVHVPFCEKLCYYCTCTKQILPRRSDQRWQEAVAHYLARLRCEFACVASCLDSTRLVHQIHLGGGTPTYLSPAQLASLMSQMQAAFAIVADAEQSVELDPRVTSTEHLGTLRELGFNRVSIGVQDFDPRVQSAVNRVQPYEQVAKFMAQCRQLGFQSVNFDLIYGLPFQTPRSLDETIRKTIALQPDRVAFYRMAVIPELFRWQNVFLERDLPSSDATCEMFLNAIESFQQAGYCFVGLDHFAKADEALARAQRCGTLRRSFQGMTTGKGLDVLGFGPSAISILGDAYAQNPKTLPEWAESIEAARPAACRGIDLSNEDLLRQSVIEGLYCDAEIDKSRIEQCFPIRFDEHFAGELEQLKRLEQDGLVELGDRYIRVTHPMGRLLLRVAAAVFDAYLPRDCLAAPRPSLIASKVG